MKYLANVRRVLHVSRAPQGARGLKYIVYPAALQDLLGRAPQGARGLKSR